MDYKRLAWAASVAAVTASLLTLVALSWWPAWFALVAVWAVAMAVIVRPWDRSEPESADL